MYVTKTNKQITDRDHVNIITKWNEVIKSHNLKGELNHLEVLSEIDDINNIKYFYLLGRSSNDSIKVAQLLYEYNDRLYLKNDTTYTCICHNCPSAVPKMSFDNWGWYCESDDMNCEKVIELQF